MKKILGLEDFKAYEFKDLDETAQQNVITDHINFWIETKKPADGSKNYQKAIKEAEQNRTPWFIGSYVHDYCYEEIVSEIKKNNYLFDKYGNLLPIRYYCDKTGNIVKTILRITNGVDIEVEITGE